MEVVDDGRESSGYRGLEVDPVSVEYNRDTGGVQTYKIQRREHVHQEVRGEDHPKRDASIGTRWLGRPVGYIGLKPLSTTWYT